MTHGRFIFTFAAMMACACCVFGDLQEDRKAANKLRNDGNVREAYDAYAKLALDPQNPAKYAINDFNMAVNCLQQLNRVGEFDDFLKKVLDVRKDDWRFVSGYHYPMNQGYIIDGKFTRGWNRGGQARFIDVRFADTLFQIKLMVKNMPPVTEEGADRFYMRLADIFANSANMGYSKAGLNILLDITQEPDYLNPHVNGSITNGTPVDADGNPVFFRCPKSFEDAKNDGERAVWAYREAMKCNYDKYAGIRAIIKLAYFYMPLYGVETLTNRGYSRSPNNDKALRNNVLLLEQLEDDETIAQLATGIKRFKLPDECNPILLWKQAVEMGEYLNAFYPETYMNLAQIYANRHQLEKALVWWNKLLETVKKEEEKSKQKQTHWQEMAQSGILQITGNWCRVDDIRKQIAGRMGSLRFCFRNGTKANFTLQRIDMDQIVADCQEYLSNLKGRGNDWNQRNFTNLAWRLFHMDGGEKKYLKETTANWSMDVTPAEKHKDRTVPLPIPAQKTGWYLLTCTMENGANTARVPLYFADTEIVEKHLMDGKMMWQVLDAKSGRPLANEKVEFFCWSAWWNDKTKRQESDHSRFAEMTDEEGKIVKAAQELFEGHKEKRGEVQIVLKNDAGRRAWYSSNGFYNGRNFMESFPENQTRAFFLTDRPVYRPGQKVEFKFWIAESQYDYEGKSAAAGQIYRVEILDPRGNIVKKYDITADSYGGIANTFELPEDAILGQYYVILPGVGSKGIFRVEEYKKPEFEVTVDTPKEAPELGDKFELTVKAKYYFGAPVSEGTAKIRILRSTHEAKWWPVRPWDWYYGNGYWWFWTDCPWYPGWAKWGCCAPRWSWYRGGFSHEAPEVVMDLEKKLEPDGTVKVTVDTAIAKELLGDRDHKYEITASVTDSSRREIHGQGSVTVAREPFKAYVWLDRGYGLVGDAMTATMQTRTLDGAPVSGKGVLKLYRVTYNKEGVAEETEERSWPVDADAQGRGQQLFSASRAGQYRLSWTLTDAKGRSVEGGQLFTVHGEGYDGRDFRYSALELIPDKAEYAEGETVKLMVNTELSDSVVMLFVRGTQGFLPLPKVIRMKGKSQIVEIPVEKKDMPNIYVEAYTMADGVLHNVIREIIVPPEKKMLDVAVKPEAERSKPGTTNKAKIVLKDSQGKPYRGSVVVSVYDKSLEYISGGSNIGDIRKFFWQWRRHHHLQGGLFNRWPVHQLMKPGDVFMGQIGMFGQYLADMEDVAFTASANFDGGVMMNTRARAAKPMMAKMARAEMLPMAAPAPQKAEAKAAGGMAMNGMAFGADMDVAEAEEAADEAGGMVEPTVRSNFADTALWIASLETDENGEADIEIPMPENLSTWKIRVWAMGNGTRVGEGATEVITTKDLIVRLEAPRFFVQSDEVVLSAIAHNYLKEKKTVDIELKLEGDCLKAKDRLKKSVKIDAGGESRVDWRVSVVKDGEAVVQMRALTDEESDAVEQKFPVIVHGADKQVAFSGALRPDQTEAKITLEIPKQRRPETTRLEVRWSPTLALAMIDAVPYLADYPYGCTEQTLNRFLPAAQTRQVLRDLGVSLADVKAGRANLNAQEIGKPEERKAQWKRYDRDPVFDEELLDSMIRKGLKDLTAMQCSDGGWGWFSGWGEHSWPHTTALVVQGLKAAETCKLVVPDDVLQRGIQWLDNYQKEQVRRLKLDPEKIGHKSHADNLDAMVYRILCECGSFNKEMEGFLYRDKAKSLSPYGLALYGLGLHYAKQADHLAEVMRNLGQFVVQDDENQTAYLNIGNGFWWCWYGDEIETQAAYLKLLAATKEQPELASRFVKYLLNNRKHATYWRSTRDTAACLDAFATYLQSSNEMNPDMTVEILLDGKVVATSKITRENLFTADLTFVAEAEKLVSGKHELAIRKTGSGPLYFNAYLSYFTLEDFITKTGLEVKVERRVYKLVRDDKMADATDSRGQAIKQRVEQYKRLPLKTGDTLESGDQLEIELIVESKNDYEYLLMEDYKAAGTEAVDLRSGYNGNEMGAYVEFRDAKVSFFLRTLARGTHSLRYRLRAEIPGKFSALPTQISGMYAPELRGNSDEFKLRIKDK